MNKDEIARVVATKLGLSPVLVRQVIDAVIEVVIAQVVLRRVVRFVGFGKFMVRTRKGRVGRDPNTGASMALSASDRVVFMPSDKLNGLL